MVYQDIGLVKLSPRNEVQQIPWTALGHKDPARPLVLDPVRGGLWLGFYQGGVVYFKDGNVRESYGAAEGFGEGHVNDLWFDKDHTLWAATDGGLSRFKSGRFATLTTKNGLRCDGVHSIVEDDDHSFLIVNDRNTIITGTARQQQPPRQPFG